MIMQHGLREILQGRHDNHIWKGYLITFMYNHIVGPLEHKYSVMENEIERVYATLVRRLVHHARSKSQRERLPMLYAFPDYPRQIMEPFDLKDVTINDGLHYHGILLIRDDTRLGTGFDAFIKNKKNHPHLVKEGGPLRRIHIEPIDRTPQKAAEYTFKAIEWRIPDPNRMLILPKAISELPDKHRKSNHACAT